MLRSFSRLSTVLAPLRARWLGSLPPDSPAPKLNFPLFQFLTVHFEYPDATLAADLAIGMPIAGDVPFTGALRPRPRPAVHTLAEWRAQLPVRNRKILDRVVNAAKSDLSEACWYRTLDEVKRGRVTTPVAVTNAVLNSVALTPRYAISESHGGRAAKVRLIDDFRASGINDTISVQDTNIPESLGVFLANLAFIRQLDPEQETRSFSLDFSHAYKHIPITETHREFASIVLTFLIILLTGSAQSW